MRLIPSNRDGRARRVDEDRHTGRGRKLREVGHRLELQRATERYR